MGRDTRFKKGQINNPKGRPPVLLPEVQSLIDQNKNAVKVAIIEQVSPKVTEWIARIIEQGVGEGDVMRLKMLLEMALGKMIEETPEFPLEQDEKLLVLEYRRRKKEQNAISG
jgi:hypothetical protein